MRHAVMALVIAGLAGPAFAQEVPEITVRPEAEAYVGPYGRDLPGVSMFAGRAAPPPPLASRGGPPLPTMDRLPQADTYQNPLPTIDSWHGTLGEGFAF